MISISSVIVITDTDGPYLQYLCVYCIPLTDMFGRALLALNIRHAEQCILKEIAIKSEGIYRVLYSMNFSYVRIVLNRRFSLAFVLFLVKSVFFIALQAVEHQFHDEEIKVKLFWGCIFFIRSKLKKNGL